MTTFIWCFLFNWCYVMQEKALNRPIDIYTDSDGFDVAGWGTPLKGLSYIQANNLPIVGEVGGHTILFFGTLGLDLFGDSNPPLELTVSLAGDYEATGWPGDLIITTNLDYHNFSFNLMMLDVFPNEGSYSSSEDATGFNFIMRDSNGDEFKPFITGNTFKEDILYDTKLFWDGFTKIQAIGEFIP